MSPSLPKSTEIARNIFRPSMASDGGNPESTSTPLEAASLLLAAAPPSTLDPVTSAASLLPFFDADLEPCAEPCWEPFLEVFRLDCLPRPLARRSPTESSATGLDLSGDLPGDLAGDLPGDLPGVLSGDLLEALALALDVSVDKLLFDCFPSGFGRSLSGALSPPMLCLRETLVLRDALVDDRQATTWNKPGCWPFSRKCSRSIATAKPPWPARSSAVVSIWPFNTRPPKCLKATPIQRRKTSKSTASSLPRLFQDAVAPSIRIADLKAITWSDERSWMPQLSRSITTLRQGSWEPSILKSMP
mmetsp:Transcript_77832/g.172467  ORF Transcript_77832/g.172467 Transcript_77832/m.172467 type:complete len:303 (-) Transcript_77832:2979-3887(-)